MGCDASHAHTQAAKKKSGWFGWGGGSKTASLEEGDVAITQLAEDTTDGEGRGVNIHGSNLKICRYYVNSTMVKFNK